MLERHKAVGRCNQAEVRLKEKSEFKTATQGISLPSHWRALSMYLLPCLIEQCFLAVLPNIVLHFFGPLRIHILLRLVTTHGFVYKSGVNHAYQVFFWPPGPAVWCSYGLAQAMMPRRPENEVRGLSALRNFLLICGNHFNGYS